MRLVCSKIRDSRDGKTVGRKGTLMSPRPVPCLLSGHVLNDRALMPPEIPPRPSLDSADDAKILNVDYKSMVPHQKEGRPSLRSSSTSSPHCIRGEGVGARGSARHPLQGAWCRGQDQSYSEPRTNAVGTFAQLGQWAPGKS